MSAQWPNCAQNAFCKFRNAQLALFACELCGEMRVLGEWRACLSASIDLPNGNPFFVVCWRPVSSAETPRSDLPGPVLVPCQLDRLGLASVGPASFALTVSSPAWDREPHRPPGPHPSPTSTRSLAPEARRAASTLASSDNAASLSRCPPSP
jgi:hypothetical protein